MSKSSAYDFVGLYSSLLKDIEGYFPNDRVEWSRDLSRITRLNRERGQPFFTIDLPSLGKILDISLRDGRLSFESQNHSGPRFKGSKIPRLFWGLWNRLFHDDGSLKQDIDPNVVFFLRTLLYVGKNLEVECAPSYLYETTKEYFDVESQISPPTQAWEDGVIPSDAIDLGSLSDINGHREGDLYLPESRASRGEDFLLYSAQRFADAVARDIGPFEPESLRFRHGPGAVSDLRGGAYKYDFPAWSPRLESIFPYDKFGVSSGSSVEVDASVGFEGLSFSEGFSKLIAVPKTQKGPRLIASEPTCNQWIQQGIADFLHSYTRRHGSLLGESICFTDQTLSGKLALSASESGRYATIDLKSASDRLSTHVVQRIFRRNLPLLNAMIACRTRFLLNRIDRKYESLHRLRKFSTQGSALTFPVQSIVFSILAIGVGIAHNPMVGWRALCRLVRVFGDDIIVPVEWEPDLRRVLTRLGLRVNDTKTFARGNFRESCGVDAWAGYDVTPPHILHPADKTNPRAILSNVAISNNFHNGGLWITADWIRTTAGHRKIPVVGPGSGHFGFRSFTGGSVNTPVRWNTDTHEWETLIYRISGKSRARKKESPGMLLQYFTTHGESWRPERVVVDYSSGVIQAGDPREGTAWVPIKELSLTRS